MAERRQEKPPGEPEGGVATEGSRLIKGTGGSNPPYTINAAPPAPIEEENPIEDIILFSLQASGVFLLLSILGVLACILRALDFSWERWQMRDLSFWVVFSPFWAADIYSFLANLYVLIATLRLRPTTADEKRNLMRVAPGQASRCIRMDMLPLARRVVYGSIGSIPALLLLAGSQALLCHSLESPTFPLVLCAAPLCLLQLLGVLESVCLRGGSFSRGLGWLLASVSTVGLVFRLANQWPMTQDVPLWVAFTPLWALAALLLLQLAYVASQTCCSHRFRLSPRVVQCMVLHLFALVLLLVASVLYCWRHLSVQIEQALEGRVHNVREIVTGVFTFIGLGLAALSIFLVMEEEVDYAISTGGYVDPLPLSRTSKGWEPTGARLDYWLLLGRVEVQARARRKAGQRGQALDSPASSPARPLQRTDSGSYANLYEDL